MFVLGIDIGKQELVASLQFSQHAETPLALGGIQTVANTPAGLQKLARWLEKQLVAHGKTHPAISSTELEIAQVQIVMEATNVYWEVCAHHFHALGCRVSVVNPAQVKFFARSTLRRGKTDAMDAEIIARFGLLMRPQAWAPSSAALVEIKQLVREREAILKSWTCENNHLKALQSGQHATPLAVRLIKQRMRLLERQVKLLETAIKQAFSAESELQNQLDLLLSIPGFGFIAAVTVLTETNGFETLEDGHQISAYSGLAPAPNQSGLSTRKGCISKVGNARLRRIAYLAALGASRSHSPMRAFYLRLRERGKPPRVALIALARKLLRVALSVVKSGRAYNPTYLRDIPEIAT